jgi:hypothetical protein
VVVGKISSIPRVENSISRNVNAIVKGLLEGEYISNRNDTLQLVIRVKLSNKGQADVIDIYALREI